MGASIAAAFVVMFVGVETGCQSGAGAASGWEGKTIRNRVNLRGEGKERHVQIYSTNYVGVDKLFVLNTPFRVEELSSRKIVLRAPGQALPIHLEFIEKHNKTTFEEYLVRTFSLEPVAVPANIGAQDRELIAKGGYAKGMSRDALFLAIGHPPASLTPNALDNTLIYEKKRFNRIVFTLDSAGRVVDIKD